MSFRLDQGGYGRFRVLDTEPPSVSKVVDLVTSDIETFGRIFHKEIFWRWKFQAPILVVFGSFEYPRQSKRHRFFKNLRCSIWRLNSRHKLTFIQSKPSNNCFSRQNFEADYKLSNTDLSSYHFWLYVVCLQLFQTLIKLALRWLELHIFQVFSSKGFWWKSRGNTRYFTPSEIDQKQRKKDYYLWQQFLSINLFPNSTTAIFYTQRGALFTLRLLIRFIFGLVPTRAPFSLFFFFE